MKYYKLTMNETFLITPEIADINEELKNLEIGDKLNIEIVEMTEEKFESMREFDGF